MQREETEGERLEREREEAREDEATRETDGEREERERENDRFDEAGLGRPDPGHDN